MEANTELSESARELHPAVLSERGLAAALQALGGSREAPRDAARAARPALQPTLIETTAYMMVSEALVNADVVTPTRPSARSSPTTAATGSWSSSTDDGIGGAEGPPPGGGLAVPCGPRGRARRALRAGFATPRRHHGPDRAAGRLSSQLALLVPRPDSLRRSGHERPPQQRRLPPVLRERPRRVHAAALPGDRRARPRRGLRDDLRRDARPLRLARLLRGGRPRRRQADGDQALQREDRVSRWSPRATAGCSPRAGERWSATTTRNGRAAPFPEAIADRLRSETTG